MNCPTCGMELEHNTAYENAYWCKNCKVNILIKITDEPLHLIQNEWERLWSCPKCGKWDTCIRWYTCERDHRDYTCYRCECGEISHDKTMLPDIREWKGKKAVIVTRFW
jgi:hypothetical protein